jgi:hypothetical protein
MKQKLFIVAVLVVVCVSGIADRRAAASLPLCGHAYCTANPEAFCTCPPGTVLAGEQMICDSWQPDCNLR